MATLIGTYDYFLFTNDKAFLSGIYPKFQKAMSYITAKIDNTGMLDVTGLDDWGRLSQGGHNTEANMLMYRTLTTASALAGWNGDSRSASSWSSMAETLKAAVNQANYDSSVGYVSLILSNTKASLTRDFSEHSKTATQTAQSIPKTATAWPSSLMSPTPPTSPPFQSN
jgi:GH15 family glucan-1,4-alpha-glucosidase